ncbi:MAG: hypothetical protein P8Z33_09520 [Gammaproteobacteria bacterium]|jgi:hypothetical protein
MNRNISLISQLMAIVALCGCVLACSAQPAAAGGPNQSTGGDGSSPPSDTAQSLGIDEQVSLAKGALAERLEVDAADVEVVTVRNVHWRSGAAGCPKPGMSYSMAIVPGILILLKSGGETYRYHAGLNREPFYCPAERAEAPVYGQGEEIM